MTPKSIPYSLDIQTTSGHIGSNEALVLVLLEVLKRLFSGGLRDIAVKHTTLDPPLCPKLHTLPRRHSSEANSLQDFFISQKMMA